MATDSLAALFAQMRREGQKEYLEHLQRAKSLGIALSEYCRRNDLRVKEWYQVRRQMVQKGLMDQTQRNVEFNFRRRGHRYARSRKIVNVGKLYSGGALKFLRGAQRYECPHKAAGGMEFAVQYRLKQPVQG